MKKKNLIASLLLAVIFLASGWALGAAQAQMSIVDTSNPRYATGSYQLNDFILLAIRVSKIILGLVGSLTLAMFIFGGQMMLVSGGSSEKVDKAKKTMIAAAIGLLIVFGSYLLIKGVMASLGLNWDGSINKPTTMTTGSTTPQ